MELLLFSNELPDDDLGPALRRLHYYAKDKRHKYLADFLHQSTIAFRDEIQQLPHVDRAHIPHVENIVELHSIPHLRKGRLAGAIDGVLLVVLELGAFIV